MAVKNTWLFYPIKIGIDYLGGIFFLFGIVLVFFSLVCGYERAKKGEMPW